MSDIKIMVRPGYSVVMVDEAVYRIRAGLRDGTWLFDRVTNVGGYRADGVLEFAEALEMLDIALQREHGGVKIPKELLDCS